MGDVFPVPVPGFLWVSLNIFRRGVGIFRNKSPIPGKF